MTVVAFDGKTIAADGATWCGSIMITGLSQKLYVVRNVCISGCGARVDILRFVDWWKRREASSRPAQLAYPSFSGKKLDEQSAFFVFYADGRIEEYNEESSFPLPHYELPFAGGAGMLSALAAMKAGANARRAVEIACEIDKDCGGEIMTVELSSLS